MAAQLPLMSASHQDWISWLHDELPPPASLKSVSAKKLSAESASAENAPIVLDLFAGCGGMALGFEACGFRTIGYEMKSQAVKTYRHNLSGECHEVMLQEGMPDEKTEVIIGGPPCQPFSQHGFQRGKRDGRDGFPIFLDAVRRIRPKIAIMENVRGLLYRNKDYLRLVVQSLEDLGYGVDVRLLKAVHYGVPQNRERVVVVASTVGWNWPSMTVDMPVTAGAALGPLAHEESADSNYLTPNVDKYIAEYERKSHCVNPRDLHLDRPARTVTCRNLGAMTSDMLRLRVPSGRRRALTVREGARLQSFPDWFEFSGTTYEQCEQIGNAVPPLMGLALARQVRQALDSPSKQHGKTTMKSNLLSANSIEEKVEQALNILRQAGIPVRDLTKRRQERLAKALLALAHLQPSMPWSEATSHFSGTADPVTAREIIQFWNEHYGENIAASSHDDVGCKDLAPLVEARLVAPTSDACDNGVGCYAILPKPLALIQGYGSEEWEELLVAFRQGAGSLSDRLSKAREFKTQRCRHEHGQR